MREKGDTVRSFIHSFVKPELKTCYESRNSETLISFHGETEAQKIKRVHTNST